MLNEINLQNEIVLREDIYKQNTLILRKGCVLNPYLLDKLRKFGINKYCNSINNNNICTSDIEILLLDKELNSKNKKIIEFAGFNADKIMQVDSKYSLLSFVGSKKLKYIFVDSSFYNQDLQENIYLNMRNTNVILFVMNCEEKMSSYMYNTDSQNVKFLYRPLANSYIKALLRLYS